VNDIQQDNTRYETLLEKKSDLTSKYEREIRELSEEIDIEK
jgi:hypothetical protein